MCLNVLVTPMSYSLSTHPVWELVKFPVQPKIKGHLWLERTKPCHPFECGCKKFVAFTRRYVQLFWERRYRLESLKYHLRKGRLGSCFLPNFDFCHVLGVGIWVLLRCCLFLGVGGNKDGWSLWTSLPFLLNSTASDSCNTDSTPVWPPLTFTLILNSNL